MTDEEYKNYILLEDELKEFYADYYNNRPLYRFVWPIYFIKSIYWCFIPINCRYCDELKRCRKGFFKLRKCKNGCIILNQKREYLREKKRREDREDYYNSLLEYAETRYKEGYKKL